MMMKEMKKMTGLGAATWLHHVTDLDGSGPCVNNTLDAQAQFEQHAPLLLAGRNP